MSFFFFFANIRDSKTHVTHSHVFYLLCYSFEQMESRVYPKVQREGYVYSRFTPLSIFTVGFKSEYRMVVLLWQVKVISSFTTQT